MKRRITVLKATSVMFAAVLMASSCQKSVDADIEKIQEANEMQLIQTSNTESTPFNIASADIITEKEGKDFRLTSVEGVKVGKFYVIAEKRNLARIEFDLVPDSFVPENVSYEAGIYYSREGEEMVLLAKLKDISRKRETWSNFPIYFEDGNMVAIDKLTETKGITVKLFHEGRLFANGDIIY